MDSIPKPQSKGEKSSSDSDKISQAIKRAKYERARKAVNDSFDRSIGSLRRRKQKRNAAMNQSFVIKQAAVLQRKNKEIIVALAKAKQYTSQLEKVNYYFKEQQLALAMKVAALERKLKVLQDEYQSVKERSELKDKVLLNLRQQLRGSLQTIESIDIKDKDCQPSTSQTMNKTHQQAVRIMRYASSKPQSESLRNRKSGESDTEEENTSPDDCKTPARHIQSPLMPVLNEEQSQESTDSEREEDDERGHISFVNVTIDVLNDASAKLDFSDCAESSASDLSEGENEDSESGKAENVDESGNAENVDEISGNHTNHDIISMELTNPEADESEVGAQADRVEKKLQQTSIPAENDPEDYPENTITTQKFTQRSSKSNKKNSAQRKKKPCTDVLNTSAYDFLSCSSDSFIIDNEKRVKLNCTKSLSPEKPKNSPKHRLSQPAGGTTNENSPPVQRVGRRQAARAISYAEPRLNSKLRRGDPTADTSLFTSFTPQRKRKISAKKKSATNCQRS